MKREHQYVLIFVVLSLLDIGVATMPSTEANEKVSASLNDSVPDRRQLRRNFFAKGAVMVVYGTKDADLALKYRTLMEELIKVARRTLGAIFPFHLRMFP